MKIIGHRGARGLAPENTLVGFKKALDHNVDEIEIDVRTTRDNKVVLMHNALLLDNAGNKLEIASHTLAELRAHKSDLATLEEALLFVNKKVPVLIELKNGVNLAPVVKIIKQFLENGWTGDDLSLLSFDYKLLRYAHRELPELPIVVNEVWSGVRGTWRARRLGTRRLNMDNRWLWIGFLKPMSKRGWQIAPYSCKVSPIKNAHKWQKYLYGVITDYPDKF